jgi:hypothetical protein
MTARILACWAGLVLGSAAWSGTALAQADACLYATDFDGTPNFATRLYQLNSANGGWTSFLPISYNNGGLGALIDIELKSDGYLYAVSAFTGPGIHNALYKINPITGQAQLIGSLGIGNIAEGDLAFNAAETLYANTGSPPRLYTVNLTTGQATLVGTVLPPGGTLRDLSSMGFNTSNGELWGIDNKVTAPSLTELLKINPAGGAILAPTPQTVTTLGGVGGMDYDPAQNRFYVADGGFGGTNVLRLLNTSGPSLTAIGPTNIPGGVAGLTVCSPCITPPSGMVAWYPFDEKTGATAHDIVPVVPPVLFNNPGFHFNGPSPLPGVVSAALHFDGVDDYVEASHQPWLSFGTGNFSIDLWIRVPTGIASQQVVLDKRDSPPLRGYHIALMGGTGEPLLQLADGTGFTNYLSGLTLADGLWHHLAVTVNRTSIVPSIRWYLDGAAAGTIGDPSNRPNSLDNQAVLRLGRRSPFSTSPGSFGGDMDELEIFRRALSSTEVRALFRAGRSGKCKS